MKVMRHLLLALVKSNKLVLPSDILKLIVEHQKMDLSMQNSTTIQQCLKPLGRFYHGEDTETLLLFESHKARETQSLLSNSQLSPVEVQKQ